MTFEEDCKAWAEYMLQTCGEYYSLMAIDESLRETSTTDEEMRKLVKIRGYITQKINKVLN